MASSDCAEAIDSSSSVAAVAVDEAPSDLPAAPTASSMQGAEPIGNEETSMPSSPPPPPLSSSKNSVQFAEEGASVPSTDQPKTNERESVHAPVGARRTEQQADAEAETGGSSVIPTRKSRSQNDLLVKLNEELREWPVLMSIAASLGVSPVTVCLTGSTCIFLFVFFGFGGQAVCTFLGCAYPGYESFKAIERFANMADDTEIYTKAASMQFWLTYWIVVAMLACAESLFYYILIWTPFYYTIKLAFLAWLFLPSTRGANHVYHWLVSPILRRNQNNIDAALDASGKKLREETRKLRTSFGGAVVSAATSVVNTPFGEEVRNRLSAAKARRKTETTKSLD